jgi:hypothetical protein
MGELIMFQPREGRVSRSRADAVNAGAQIMFFTGVRYERMADPPALAAADSGAPPAGDMGGTRGGRRRRRG